MKFHIEGLVPAMLTSFTKNGERVDYEKACALAVRLAGQGVAGIFPCGTTGEGLLMSLAERKQLIEELVPAVGNRIKVIVHVGCLDTASSVELARHAAQTGAAAVGVVAPGFYSYDDASLARHFKAVAAAAALPVFIYNIPGCAKNAVSPELVVRLANQVDNIIGLKDSSGNIQNVIRVLDGAPKGFNLLNGVDEYTYQAMLTGANGSVTSTANVAPWLFLNIYKELKKGNLKKARVCQTRLTGACGVFQYGRMVARYKEGLRLRGFDAGYVRPPQRELTAAERKTFAKQFKEAGLLD